MPTNPRPRRSYRGVSYELRELSGDVDGFICSMASWGGQRCRLTTVKRSEAEAVEAAERWIDRAVAERTNPDAPTYRWVPDPEELIVGGFICARIAADAQEPILE